MRFASGSLGVLRAFCLMGALFFCASSLQAQSPAIQPCESAPAVRPGVEPAPAKVATHVTETIVDESIPGDPNLEKLLGPYSEKVKELSVPLATIDGELRSSGIGGNSLGQLVGNALMATARAKLGSRVSLVVTNTGGLRKSLFAAGELTAGDIFELLPFENSLIEVQLSGSQLLTLLEHIVKGSDIQSGARIQFRWNDQARPEFLSAKLVDEAGRERDIDPSATYTVVTIDYLLNLRSGNYTILQDAKNIKPLGITVRESVIEYLKSQKAAGRSVSTKLDDRFVQIGPSPERPQSRP